MWFQGSGVGLRFLTVLRRRDDCSIEFVVRLCITQPSTLNPEEIHLRNCHDQGTMCPLFALVLPTFVLVLDASAHHES